MWRHIYDKHVYFEKVHFQNIVQDKWIDYHMTTISIISIFMDAPILACSFRNHTFCPILLIKPKCSCFKTKVCYENDKITAKVQKMHKTQLGYLYESQITKWTFHHNRVCKLKLERFPVLLLITWIACIKRN